MWRRFDRFHPTNQLKCLATGKRTIDAAAAALSDGDTVGGGGGVAGGGSQVD